MNWTAQEPNEEDQGKSTSRWQDKTGWGWGPDCPWQCCVSPTVKLRWNQKEHGNNYIRLFYLKTMKYPDPHGCYCCGWREAESIKAGVGHCCDHSYDFRKLCFDDLQVDRMYLAQTLFCDQVIECSGGGHPNWTAKVRTPVNFVVYY